MKNASNPINQKQVCRVERKDFRILLFRFTPYSMTCAGSGSMQATAWNLKQDTLYATRMSSFPPFGLSLLSAVLKRAGYEQVSIIDAWAEEISEENFLEKVEKYNPHAVGCTLWTTSLEFPILKKIKQRLPNTVVVVGGPHLDIYSRECMSYAGVIDFGVVGEGEETAIELVDCIRTGTDVSNVKGIVYRQGDKVICTGEREPVEDLDSLPYPDFSDLPIRAYKSAEPGPVAYIFSSRSCPYRCQYCFNSRGRVFRKHSVEYVIQYMKFLKQRYNVKRIGFLDETFTFEKDRTLQFCNQLQEQKIALPFTIRTRADHVDEDILRALKTSGCYRIHYGVESGNQEMLDAMNRRMTLSQIQQAVILTKKQGILVSANFMIGYLDESRATYEKTLRFIEQIDPDHINIFITTILPGTALYKKILERGMLKRDVWREHALGKLPSLDAKELRLPGKDYSIDDLDQMLINAYRRIYFRPAFVIKKLSSIHDLWSMRRYLLQAMNIISVDLSLKMAKLWSGSARCQVFILYIILYAISCTCERLPLAPVYFSSAV